MFMHMNEVYACEDNAPGKMYMGLPISASTSPYLYECKDAEFLADNKPDSLEYLKLNFICLEEVPSASWYVMLLFIIILSEILG